MQENNVSVANFESCQKCNICAEVCPMMEVNPLYAGPKQSGPDGERYRLKDPAFFDSSLKYCLNCKRCEVACPSGVKVGDIIAVNKLKYYKSDHKLRDFALASTDLVGSLASPLAPVANFALKLGVVKNAMDGILGVSRHRQFPEYSREKFVDWMKGQKAAQHAFPLKVHYFHGCYANYNYPQLGKDFVTLMNACGYGVELLEKEKCCGVALIANAMGDQARKQAKVNLASIRKAGGPVLTTSSTCTFTIRDEYDHVLGLPTSDVRDSVMLATRWLYRQVESGSVKLVFKDGYKRKIAYHTACHMQKMGWQQYSIELLRMIPGIYLTVLEQDCCGISGTYGFKKENYEYSQKVGSKLLRSIRSANPEIIATDCETCKWQIEDLSGLPVMNPVSILAEALDLEKTKQANVH